MKNKFFINVIFFVILSLGCERDVWAQSHTIENDRNLDGAADSWEYFKDGKRVRWDLDKNFDGEVDGVIHFQDSFVAFSEIDSNFDGSLDDRFYFKNGVRTLNEYDKNYDGRVDRWEHFDGGGRLARTELDEDFDGKVDSISEKPSRSFVFKKAGLAGNKHDR